jgi:hypothetical protein
MRRLAVLVCAAEDLQQAQAFASQLQTAQPQRQTRPPGCRPRSARSQALRPATA